MVSAAEGRHQQPRYVHSWYVILWLNKLGKIADLTLVMALVTYVLLSTLLAGFRGQFQPELLYNTTFTAGVVVAVEILLLKLGCYFLSISNESQLFDLVAYSGYKFVGVIVTLAIAEIVNGGKGTGGLVGWSVFFYTFSANSFFLVSTDHNARLKHFQRRLTLSRCAR